MNRKSSLKTVFLLLFSWMLMLSITGCTSSITSDLQNALDEKEATENTNTPTTTEDNKSNDADKKDAEGKSDDGESRNGDLSAKSDAKLVLLADKLELLSGDSGSVRITANVKDQNNIVLSNENITFKSTSGSLKIEQALSDELGNAIATLTSGFNPTPRTVTVTASGGGSSATVDVAVVGTALTITGPSTPIATGQNANLTIKLKAGDGGGLKNEAVTITSLAGNVLGSESVTTNDQGEAQLVVTDSKNINDTITVSAFDGTVTASYELKVSPNSFSFVAPVENREIALETDQAVSTRLVQGTPVSGKSITFSITRGLFSNGKSSVTSVTGADGIAKAVITSKQAGGSTITADTGEESATLTVEFIATEPSWMTLNPTPATVSFDQTSKITATVRDEKNNLVKNARIVFHIDDDITGGNFQSAGTILTNSLGEASTVYRAGNQSSGKEGVVIRADVQDSTVTKTTAVTVEPKNVRIIFGTGNGMNEPNSVQYRQPFAIQVSDDGVPVAGTQVKLRVTPVNYRKGRYIGVDSNQNGDLDSWRALTTATCPAEDADQDGVLDAAEDLNGDGRLTPPASVSVGAEEGLSPTVSNAVVTTDDNGFGYFGLFYPQNFAMWIEVEVVAQTIQAGKETTFSTRVVPLAIASDLQNIDIAPPAPDGSPFGVGSSCNDTL